MNQSSTNSTATYFFMVLLSVALVLVILIFMPFLSPLVLAMALAIIFMPFHRKVLRAFFRKREQSSLGAAVTVLLIVIVVFVPLGYILYKMYFEVQAIYAFLIDEGGRAQVINALNGAAQSISRFFGAYPAYSFDSFNAVALLQQFAQWILTNINFVFSEASKVVIGLVVMLLALFYFLRDGHELKRQLIALSPLPDTDDEHIFTKLEQAVRSIFAGSISVGIMEGIQIGVGFAIFGVPSPALWGAVASLAALIPGIGVPVVLGSGIIFLLFMGLKGAAIGLLIWGIVAITVIDNFLGPLFMNRGIKIHPFLILLSVLGGVVFFGPIGIVLGPLVLAFLFSLLEIHTGSKKKTESE